MDRSLYLFAGVIGSFALSCYALVVVPQAQFGNLSAVITEDEGKITDPYPVQNAGIVEKGRAIYASEGCVYCHTQQVRDVHTGTDIARGWGDRRTVARDHIYEQPPFLGSTRLGPDLANVGSPKWRNESADPDEVRKPKRRDAAWHLRHLYEPRTIITESNMPPYRYLFEKRKISGQRSVNALELGGKVAPEEGYEIVPRPEALALVGYLLSLDRSHPVPEVQTLAASATAAAPAAAAVPASAPAAAPK